MVWILFFARALFLALVLYVPGLLCLCGLSIPGSVILAISPAFSIVVLSIAMTVLSICGIAAGWPVYALLLILLCLFGLYLNGMKLTQLMKSARKNGDCSMTLLYLAISFVLAVWVYVKTLDGPGSVIPLFDNANTLSMIRSMMNSDHYGPILSSNYLDSPSLDSGVSYYPGVLHSISALLAKMTSCEPPVALNVTTFVSLCSLLPLSVYSLIESCFPNKKGVVLCGAFAPLAFAAFPWNLITFGPLLTNLFSLTLVPAFIAVLLLALEADGPEDRVSLWFGVGLTGVALGLAHPGALFSAGVIAVPLIVKEACSFAKKKGANRVGTMLVAMACVSVAAAIWWLCYNLPPLRPTVSYTWPAFMNLSEAFSKLITLAFSDYPAQLVNALVVFIGASCIVRRGEDSGWLIVSALLASFLYCVDVTSDGTPKQLLCGFWYTDSRRVAAIAVIPLMPIFAYGLARIGELCSGFARRQGDTAVSPVCYGACAVLLVAFSVYAPSLEVRGSFTLESAMGSVRGTLESLNGIRSNSSVKTMLDGEEVESGVAIKEIVGDDIVLNNPMDGSSFLYGLDDVRVFYRSTSTQEPGEQNQALRCRINDYASDVDVRDKAVNACVKYVLQLDSGNKSSIRSTFNLGYDPDYWIGIQGVSSSTPGFELVYSKGDIRLYRLTGV